MTEAFRLEARRSLRELGEALARVLVGVARQRAEGFELAERLQPDPEPAARCPPPAFQRERDLRVPQRDGRDRREDLVLTRVQEIDQALQLRDALAGVVRPG